MATKYPQSVIPFSFFLFSFFLGGYIREYSIINSFYLKKVSKFAIEISFFWRGCGHIHMYWALATEFKSSLANGNLPRHSDSIRKLGAKKKKKTSIIRLSILIGESRWWWIDWWMVNRLMDDEPIDGHWWWWSVTFFFPSTLWCNPSGNHL